MDGGFVEPILDCSFHCIFEGSGNSFVINCSGRKFAFDGIVDQFGSFRRVVKIDVDVSEGHFSSWRKAVRINVVLIRHDVVSQQLKVNSKRTMGKGSRTKEIA